MFRSYDDLTTALHRIHIIACATVPLAMHGMDHGLTLSSYHTMQKAARPSVYVHYVAAKELLASHAAAIDARYADRHDAFDNKELNLGALFRSQLNGDGVIGLSSFYDVLWVPDDTGLTHDARFSQWVLGAEYLPSKRWHASVNKYVALKENDEVSVRYGWDAALAWDQRVFNPRTRLRIRLGMSAFRAQRTSTQYEPLYELKLMWKKPGMAADTELGMYVRSMHAMDTRLPALGIEFSVQSKKKSALAHAFISRPVYRDAYIRLALKPITLPDKNESLQAIGDLVDVYVINLDKHADRLQTMQEYMDQEGIAFTRFAAVDGRALFSSTTDVIDQGIIVVDPDDSRSCSESLGCFASQYNVDGTPKTSIPWAQEVRGHIGCTLSHKGVLAHYQNSSDKPYVLILEDDAVADVDKGTLAQHLYALLQDHQRLQKNGVDIDAMILSRVGTGVNSRLHLSQVKRPEPGSHAYIVPAEKVDTFMQHLQEPYAAFYDAWWYQERSGMQLYAPNRQALYPRERSLSEVHVGASSTNDG